ncbi:hypothetical protein PCASD_12878 [Puccinia coronata f. sp. avenae]|uniref:Uncharacterized protein n=1 Tax=Puccinia coronata f. sp. avenae TaxID=200324 RepID=A0A2N5T8V6_9BASI|nr:hypothetical protein PCASD_12878 [Puccinia coronata f. sp. avenae]
MEAVAAVTTAHTVEADESIFAPRCITDIDLLKLEDSPKIHKDYLQAENRLIFIGDVKEIEHIYGHIKKLNLSGENGIKLSAKNKAIAEYPDVGPLEIEASRIIEELGITELIDPQKGTYSTVYYVTQGSKTDRAGKSTKIAKRLKDIIDSKPQNNHLQVEYFKRSGAIEIRPKYYYSKRMLAEALFSQRRQVPIDFALSLGFHELNECMHQAMISRGHYALGIQPTPGKVFSSYASHRLEDDEQLISLLKKLTEGQIKNPNYCRKSLAELFQAEI